MNLQKLTELAADGAIHDLELLSLEGGFYVARITLDQGKFTLMNQEGTPMHLPSITYLRELLQRVPTFPCVLVQQCVHDEMCGAREGVIESLRIPFSLVSP